MPGEEDRVGSSTLLAASATQQQQQQPKPQQQQQSVSAANTNIVTTLDKLKQQLQQQQQQQSKPFQSSLQLQPHPLVQPPPSQVIPIINVNPSSIPTSGTPSVGGSVGDILHHASIDDDDEDADDEEDICGSNSKLELELQFAGIDNENVELDIEEDDVVNGPLGGRPRVSSAHPHGFGGSLSAVDHGVGGISGVEKNGEETLGDEVGEGDVEGGKAPTEPPEPPEPTFAEKCLFYTTAFFILLAVFSLFAFLFLVPFVIDPAFTTIFMKFDPEPAECLTVSRINLMGITNCSWTSCREGCTREIYNCTQIRVHYRARRRTTNTQTTQINTAASSSAYTSYYSSYSKSTHSQHDPGASIPGVRWNTYTSSSASLNHIYQSTNNNYISKNSNSNNKLSAAHYQSTNHNNKQLDDEDEESGGREETNYDELLVGGSRGRSSRAVPLIGDNLNRNSVVSNGNHKKKKHKVIPSFPNDIVNDNNFNVLQSVNINSESIPWASSLTTRSGNNGGGGDSRSSRQQQLRQESKWDYEYARLYPNVKGCGYPPMVNCSTFVKKYGQLGVNFSCYYSQVDRGLVVTTYDMNQVVMDLVYSMAIPIPSFIISVVYLIFAYFRIYNMDSSSNPPPASSETANSSNPHDNNSANNTNNNIGGSNGDGGGSNEPDGETSFSADDKTRIIQRSTSRGLNVLPDKQIPNSAKGIQPLIQMNDLTPSHLPVDGDLILPRRNNRAPERNGPTNPQAKNKGETENSDSPCEVDVVRERYLEPGVLPEKNNSLPPIEFSQLPKNLVQIQVRSQCEQGSRRKSSEDCSEITSTDENDDDDECLNSEWADGDALKRSFQGLNNISWKPK